MSGEEWICGECGNINTRKECVKCDARRPPESTALVPTIGGPPARFFKQAYCQFDGASLDERGWCAGGNGYPVTAGQPDVCPFCRQPLDWSGGCVSCHGSFTPEDHYTWTFPGARYETHDEKGHAIGDGQHWVLQAKGPRRACTPEQNAEAAKMLARVLGVFAERANALHG